MPATKISKPKARAPRKVIASNSEKKPELVQTIGALRWQYFLHFFAFFVALMLALFLPQRARAETPFDRAILNAGSITVKLHGVYPQVMRQAVQRIAEGKLPRLAPEQPIWIMESETGTILYYQGQPSFTDQPASKLIDDEGQRFGQVAIDRARESRSTWLSINLAGVYYRAYCKAQVPTVVCSLAI